MSPMEFTVTEDHLKLLERSYFGWCDYAYDGAPGMDPKRPFGNSDVIRDVFEITNDDWREKDDDFWEDFYDEEHPELERLFRDMEYVVQITTHLAGKGELIRPGVYRRPERYDSLRWVRAE